MTLASIHIHLLHSRFILFTFQAELDAVNKKFQEAMKEATEFKAKNAAAEAKTIAAEQLVAEVCVTVRSIDHEV